MAGLLNHLVISLLTILISCRTCYAQCASELSVAIFPDTTPRQDGSIRLRCNVSADNHDQASWYRDQIEVVRGLQEVTDSNDNIFRPDEIDVGDGCVDFGILIFPIVPGDTGTYTCRLGNATSNPLDVQVVYEPEEMYPTCGLDFEGATDVSEGDNVLMVCRSQTGYPAWSLTWSSDFTGGNGTVLTTNGYTTSLLELPATRDVFGATFTCSATCESFQGLNCSSSEARTCSVDGFLFTASPRQRRIDNGGNVTYGCETSIRGYSITWFIREDIASVTINCSPDNASCNLTVSNASELMDGLHFRCVLKSDRNEMVKNKTVTLYVGPEPPSTVQTTTVQVTTQQLSTTSFIPTPPPIPPTPPPVPPTTVLVTTTSAPTTAQRTTPYRSTSPYPTTTPSPTRPTTRPTTTESPTTTQKPITVHVAPSSRAPPVLPVSTLPSTTVENTSHPVTTSSGASQAPLTGGIGVGEVIAIVVTIAILLIILVVLFTFLLIRGRRTKAEKRGKLRRDAAMLDAQAPSPFNAYDMQTVIGGKDAEEMKGPTGGSRDKFIPITEPEDDYAEGSFDNHAYENDSAVHASIPSNPETPPEPIYYNGSIDQGYYEHYPDSEAGGTTLVRGIISTVL